MICPSCGAENIQGADECIGCKQDLTYLDEPAASSHVERVLMESPVRMLKPAAPICVAPETTVQEVCRTLRDKKIGCVLVTRGPNLLGIFSERDVLMKLGNCEPAVEKEPIQNWMTPNPITVHEMDSIAFAVHKMDIGGYRHLPVIKDGRAKGVISVRDVVGYLATQLTSPL